MKKTFLSVTMILLIVFLYGCKGDDSTSSVNIEVISTNIQKGNDTLIISFNVQNTTYSFSNDTNLVFTKIPIITYNLVPTDTNGYGDFNLYSQDSTILFSKHFDEYMGGVDSTLTVIPWLSKFSITNFTGSGYIKVIGKQ
jgi:hypothetical protein